MTWRSISTSRRLLLNAKYLKQVLRIEGGKGVVPVCGVLGVHLFGVIL